MILTANLTDNQYAQRDFRTSQFAQFASNMAFEVYQPQTKGDKTIHRRELNRRADTATPAPTHAAGISAGLIRLLVNEVPVQIPGCSSDIDSFFCEWSTLKNILLQRGAGCDFVSCCGVSPGPYSGRIAVPSSSQVTILAASNATCLSTTPLVA